MRVVVVMFQVGDLVQVGEFSGDQVEGGFRGRGCVQVREGGGFKWRRIGGSM